MYESRKLSKVDGKPVILVAYRAPGYAVVIDCDKDGYKIDESGNVIGSQRTVPQECLAQDEIRPVVVNLVKEQSRGKDHSWGVMGRIRFCKALQMAIATAQQVAEQYKRLQAEVQEAGLSVAQAREQLPDVERLIDQLAREHRQAAGDPALGT